MTVAHLIAVPPVVIAGNDRAEWQYGDPTAVEFSIVIPFHNPGAALRSTVERISDALYAQGIPFEVLAVSGGTKDGSERTLDDLSRTRVIAQPDIQDRGAALQAGFAAARGAWIGFVDVDADSEVDPYELIECLHRAREEARALAHA
ncbi:glycosyltransferase family 2 protein [Actinoplanes sp. RD1]|uniref:glycosyltransferase family 2 protein n=1 Tax=Actinoplanes sp. RD1 TaxID=3064538 RepID=UPI0027418F03|nr:glycosyltransferase [Actinoplanes sp. RD1]